MSKQETTLWKTFYNYVKSHTMHHCPESHRKVVENEFHPIFTFIFGCLLIQIAYFMSLVSRGSLSDFNIISRQLAHIHVAIMLIGGAMIRCLIGYLIAQKHLTKGQLFDYALPNGGKGPVTDAKSPVPTKH